MTGPVRAKRQHCVASRVPSRARDEVPSPSRTTSEASWPVGWGRVESLKEVVHGSFLDRVGRQRSGSCSWVWRDGVAWLTESMSMLVLSCGPSLCLASPSLQYHPLLSQIGSRLAPVQFIATPSFDSRPRQSTQSSLITHSRYHGPATAEPSGTPGARGAGRRHGCSRPLSRAGLRPGPVELLDRGTAGDTPPRQGGRRHGTRHNRTGSAPADSRARPEQEPQPCRPLNRHCSPRTSTTNTS